MTTDAVGGVWTYAIDLARGLAQANVRTTLLVLGPRPAPAQRQQAHAIRGLRLVETGLELDWTASHPDDLQEAVRLVATFVRQLRPDLLHLNAPALAATVRFDVPVLGVCHSCLASWWAATEGGPMPEPFRWRTELLRLGLARCDALVAPSAAFAGELARIYDLPAPIVVHNGRDLGSVESPMRWRHVFTAGRLWDRGKNAAVLDAAAALLDVPILAAGPVHGPNGDSIAFRHLKPLGSLSCAGVRARMAEAPVFAAPALYEPFGLTVLEAAQAGCALVLSDIASFRELWRGAARFVPARDPLRIASVLRDLVDNPAETAALGEAARKRAARYTAKRMIRQVLEIYERLGCRAGVPCLHEAAA